MTIDASGVAVQATGQFNIHIQRARLINGLCHGLTINGPNVIVADSIIEHNAWPTSVPGRGDLDCTDAPGGLLYGAGVYVTAGNHAPVFSRTTIRDSFGPSIDSWGGRNGYITHSHFTNEIGWAAIHLYDGATGWTIADSTVTQIGASFIPHAHCYPVSHGLRGAAIRACLNSGDLTVVRTVLTGGYALLADETSPDVFAQDNTYNDLPGIVHHD